MTWQRWATHNKDGSEKECKFCHEHVWWCRIEHRWYEPGGEVLHTDVCELRKEFYRQESAIREESRRQNRAR